MGNLCLGLDVEEEGTARIKRLAGLGDGKVLNLTPLFRECARRMDKRRLRHERQEGGQSLGRGQRAPNAPQQLGRVLRARPALPPPRSCSRRPADAVPHTCGSVCAAEGRLWHLKAP